MDTEISEIYEAAHEAASWFQTGKRLKGGDREGEAYLFLAPDAPQWISDMVYEAHDGMLPDDYKYAFIYAACDFLGDPDGYTFAEDARDEFCEANVSPYTADQLKWLSSNLRRLDYVNQAYDELGKPDTVESAIAAGWAFELGEVFDCVVAACLKQTG